MPTPSDQGGRPVTPCPKCRTTDVKAVALAANFVYLRCHACAFLFVIEDAAVMSARSVRARSFPVAAVTAWRNRS